MAKEWNIQQLNIARKKDLAACQDDAERRMADVVCRREILETAKAQYRISPAARAILLDLFDVGVLRHHEVESF
jgi:hypothetical protein